MKILDKFYAYSHANVMGSHKTTIEITKDNYITKKGDCIVGINSSKGCIDLSPELKKSLKRGKKIKVILEVDNYQDHFYGFGNNKLKIQDKNDIVFRKSDFICERTVLINCTKSARDLNRDLIEKLKESGRKLLIKFEEYEPR